MIQYSATVWSLPPARLSCQGAERTCWGAESRESMFWRGERTGVWGSSLAVWQQTQGVSFLSFILVFLILGEYLIGSRGLKFKAQKDIKRERFPYLLFFSQLKIIFNWKIIALQYCVGFCHVSTWISHRHTYVPSLPPRCPVFWYFFYANVIDATVFLDRDFFLLVLHRKISFTGKCIYIFFPFWKFRWWYLYMFYAPYFLFPLSVSSSF